MSLFAWLRKKPQLSEADQARLFTMPNAISLGDQLLSEQRFVVVDLESTGLNYAKDKILSIGAVVIEQQSVQMGQQFERTLNREHKLSESVLIHQIAPSQVAAGVRTEEGMLDFLEFVADSPLLAFHADFDKNLLMREFRDIFSHSFRHPFFDLAELCPMLYPDHGIRAPKMDDWVEFFGLQVLQRHNACADALATAELMLILLAKCQSSGIKTLKDLDVSLNNWRRRQGGGMG